MDVDPLKPQNIPLSSDTILYFEFLLKPQLLNTHLENPNPTPSAIELLSQFLSVNREIPLESGFQEHEFQFNRKEIALKILTLKIVANLKWNLEILEKNLPMRRQVQVLSYLCSITSGKLVSLPSLLQEDIQIAQDGSEHALKFALTFSHLWIIRMPVVHSDRVKLNHTVLTNIQDHLREDHYINSLFCVLQKSVDYLINLENSDESFKILTMNSFKPFDMNSESVKQTFNSVLSISSNEIKTQINFDLCSYFLHTKKYKLAKERAIKCRENLDLLKKEYNNNFSFKFCIVNDEKLMGLLLACGIEKKGPGLLQNMIECGLKKYDNLVEIIEQDNMIKEIPLTHRRMVELDLELASNSGSVHNLGETLMNVSALNTIRGLIEDTDSVSFVDFMQKYKNPKDFQILIQTTDQFLTNCSLKDRLKIKDYFLNILLNPESSNSIIENGIKSLKLFSDLEFNDIIRQREDMDIDLPIVAMQTEWKVLDIKNPTIDRMNLERQLVSCFTANGVRKLLVKLAAFNPKQPLWSLFHCWNIPIPLHSTLLSLQEGFLQDFSYILIGKSRELREKKDFNGAINLLNVLRNELKRPEFSGGNQAVKIEHKRQDFMANQNIIKLSKLVTWEILLYQIFQTLEEWPIKAMDDVEFITKCKQCFTCWSSSNSHIISGNNSNNGNDDTIPRLTITENCAAMLLNLNDWDSIMIPVKKEGKCPSLIELVSLFASVGADKEKFKGTTEKCINCWEYILQMFLINDNKKQRNMQQSQHTSTLMVSTALTPFIKRLREPMVISILISLLANLHNILKDDSNLNLNAEYMFFWPDKVSSPSNSYDIKLVSEALNTLLQQSLKYYPNNLAWVKLKGDLEFANGNNEAAMRYYVNAIVSSTEYGTRAQRTLDDFLIRRMIKCSMNLGCFMQAAVLCQFLNEIDYSMAFKNLSEKTSSYTDSMDAYYSCIWDPTLLEFIINSHSKKGEHTKKLQAITYMGLLELNANNSDDIKFEAAEVRKTHFIRALAKQYLL